ncbi:MAG TPA: type II secretion system protein [Candidatus Saccharibacteria bacterium]|nr:type II secretion system protein [Candidatus Saccharibacteria bacterium]
MNIWIYKLGYNPEHKQDKKPSGFTIVELLIVIVVIGILATLTFVVYRNITGKAQAAVTSNIVQQYSKALAAYKLQNDSYPDIDSLADLQSSAGVCLGTGYENKGCGSNFGEGQESEEFNQLMKNYIGTAPDIRPHTTSYHFNEINITLNGIILQHLGEDNQTLNGQPVDAYAITYALDEPDAQCIGGEVLQVGSIPGTNYLTGNFKNTLTDGKNTGCFVKLPD